MHEKLKEKSRLFILGAIDAFELRYKNPMEKA